MVRPYLHGICLQPHKAHIGLDDGKHILLIELNDPVHALGIYDYGAGLGRECGEGKSRAPRNKGELVAVGDLYYRLHLFG